MKKDRSLERYGLSAKDKAIVELLEETNEHLERIVELLERQGRIQPGGV